MIGTRFGTQEFIDLENKYGAQTYHPLDVVIERAEGVWVYDVEGNKYLDCLASYSAVNQGHSHPKILQAMTEQAQKVTLTSRAFRNDQLPLLVKELHDLTGYDMALPMNSGAEAVETAIKVARKWGYDVKGVPAELATIIVAEGNFHGRTTTIVSFSDDQLARTGFGPYTPGFRAVPYGDAGALAAAIDATTVAVLLEPIQGEAGVVIPPDGYLTQVRELCTARGVLFLADEIQSGLGRTGTTFACDHEQVVPDVYILGKALGGGILPLSAIAADRDVLGVLHPGEHGSTFGGNPFACSVGRAVIALLDTGQYQRRARLLGELLDERLRVLVGRGVERVRTRGLWAGIDIDPTIGTGREICEALAANGLLTKDTHGSTIRLAPPLVISTDELDLAVEILTDVLANAGDRP
jgi:ornithine--oxo-acid transaminase